MLPFDADDTLLPRRCHYVTHRLIPLRRYAAFITAAPDALPLISSPPFVIRPFISLPAFTISPDRCLPPHSDGSRLSPVFFFFLSRRQLRHATLRCR